MKDTTTFDLDRFLPYRLSVLSGRTSRSLSRIYGQRFGISIAEWRVLAHLSQNDRVSVREIHARADMDRAKVSRAVQRLEARGAVSKSASPIDRRLVALSLTPKGRALVADIVDLALDFETDLLSVLTPAETDALTAILGKLDRSLSD